MVIFKNHVVEEEEEEERGGSTGGRCDDGMVVVRRPGGNANGDEPHVVTVNCPDKTGLGCDLCRVILTFGLDIVRGGNNGNGGENGWQFLYMDVTTDGRWCYILFWVMGKRDTGWGLLKRRLREACPPIPSIRSCWFGHVEQPRAPDIFLLKFWCSDRLGLLHDVTKVLCELELVIRSVKVSTTPDGKVVGLFFLTDVRELLRTSKRRDDVINHLKSTLKDSFMYCEIELANAEVNACIKASSSLPSTIMEEFFDLNVPKVSLRESLQGLKKVFVTVDNSLSPSHTIIHISCWDHKGLVYDIMRIMKDYNIQISYGRFNRSQRGGSCDMELLVMQADGSKLTDARKQKALCSRLTLEISRPLLVTQVNRGPDQELLVANLVELSGKGRPLVFHEITRALRELNICFFSGDIGRHVICNREWEVYRLLLPDDCSSPATSVIGEMVLKKLMSWN